MPISPKRLPITEHLRELRYRLIIVVIIVFVGSVAMYFPAPHFYRLVMQPILHIFEGQDLMLIKPFETFTLRFKAAFYATIVLGSPIIIWQIMAFFLPALKPNERRWVVPTFATMVVLFATGIVFAHQIIIPTAFSWLAGQVWEGVVQMPEANEYFSGAMVLLLGFGIVFQLPVIVFYLLIFNVVPYHRLRSNWRVVYAALAVIAAMATPPDPVTMLSFALVLIGLYEFTMLLARIVLAKRIAKMAQDY